LFFFLFFRSKNDAASPERCSRQVGLESSTNQSIQSIRERESLVFWRVFDGFVFFIIVYSRRPLRLSARASRPGGGGGWAETKRERKTVDDETAAGKIIALFVARQSKAIFFSSFGGRDKA